MGKKDKKARIITALTIAGVMLLGVAVAPVAATIGTQISAFDDQDKSQRCKKNKKSQKKKCKSSSPTPSGTSVPSTAPTGGGGEAAGRVSSFHMSARARVFSISKASVEGSSRQGPTKPA